VVETKAALHITFNMSIAGSVRQALRMAGREGRVVGFSDDLSFGPIGVSPAARAGWIAGVVGFDFAEIADEAEKFWREAVSPDVETIAWVCREDAGEYCGFLEFLSRIGDAPISVIDATGIEVTNWRGEKFRPRSLDIVNPAQMLEAGLLDGARTAEPAAIKRYRRVWDALKAENAPLRIVTATGLASAPLTHFAPWLLRHCTEDWKKGALVVGQALGDIFESEGSPHVGDLWLWGRVCALADEGVLEISGDETQMQNAHVRCSQGGN